MTRTIQAFFDTDTGTISYVLHDGRHAAIIDPVLDYDPAAARTSTHMADQIVDYVTEQKLTVQWLLETHAHADHLSAAAYLKSRLGGRIAIGEHILQVQEIFKTLYNLDREFLPNGSQFDQLLKEGETIQIGTLSMNILWVPGHTLADLAFQVDDVIFVGDTLFMPDVGTARTDFPGGSARSLYRSIRKLLALPENTLLMHCHDYPPAGRDPLWASTVAQQRAENIHVHDGISEDEFVAMREARDATLAPPRLILPSLQVNIRAGQLPPAEDNGTHYLKIPLNKLAIG
ncbi:MBL fold metallo-hydrolase [Castellaniella sp.]|uniref:MBL fold metallo-hydrolase n=1 Tax=Castellaniella sp. TaxID=1955812 RepID=UPI003563364B